MDSKVCRDCKLPKPLDDFPPSKKNLDGRSSYCRPCMRVRSRASYRKRMTAKGRTVAERRIVPEGHRWCPDCRVVKPLDEFPRNTSGRAGRGRYCLPCHKVRGEANRIKNHGSTRNYHLKRRYGITQDDVDRMLEAQGHNCAVCKKADPEHVDHDHATGEVRGMLCFNCNQALGNARDDVRVLRNLVRYLYASRGLEHSLLGESFRPHEGNDLVFTGRLHKAAPVTPNPDSPVEVAFAKLIGT